jgi:hypothetical protein
MENNTIINEEQLKGILSITIEPGKSLSAFCKLNFNNFDPDRYEALALRVFHGKETVVTLYALDKKRDARKSQSSDTLPVKKFKSMDLSITQLLPYIKEYNFTVSSGNYPVDKMEVINR